MTAIATERTMNKPPYQIFLEEFSESINQQAKSHGIGHLKSEIVHPSPNLTCCDLQIIPDDDEVYPVYRMTVRPKYEGRWVARLTNLDDNHVHVVVADPLTVLQLITF